MEKRNQDYLRGDGKLPSILVEARTLSEGWQKAMISCMDYGIRAETPKQRKEMNLGYDADINVRVTHPLEDIEKNQRHMFGLYDDDRGIMQYILEVTHGIHNHWKKDINNPEDKKWGYTYNERFFSQIPFILARIKKDWYEKKEREGEGRITGRDYQFGIWRPEEDIILEQEDPPCWQRGHFRFLKDENGDWVLNYVTDWRSRDLTKAWLENNIAQVYLQKLFAEKVSNVLGVSIKIGTYTDRSSSLHIYGKYVDEDRVENMVKKMKENNLENMLVPLFVEDRTQLKRLIAAQTHAEDKGLGKNLSKSELIKLEYDVENYPYPEDWDFWDKRWNLEPDKNLFRKSF